MELLTEVDLKVMNRIRNHEVGLEFDRTIRSPLRAPEALLHRDMFTREDGDSFADLFFHYDHLVAKSDKPKVPASAMQELFNQGMRTKVSSVSSQFKARLQRPRPYQMDLLFGQGTLTYVRALTADTPSMCGGHSVQGILAIGGILERWLKDELFESFSNDLKLQEKSKEALGQWAVDFGDRRVMAGLHYPSDHLASWIIFARLADRVYSNPEVKRNMCKAIQNQSYVYRAIVEEANGNAEHVYAYAIAELKSAAETSEVKLLGDPGLTVSPDI
jgi:hypothetical protein